MRWWGKRLGWPFAVASRQSFAKQKLGSIQENFVIFPANVWSSKKTVAEENIFGKLQLERTGLINQPMTWHFWSKLVDYTFVYF